MGNKNKAGVTKTPKPQTKVEETTVEQEVIVAETVEPEKTPKKENALQISVGRREASKLSPDSKVQLGALIQERYVRNPEATIAKYGKEYLAEMDDAIDVLVVLSLCDVRQECLEQGIPLLAKGTGKQLMALSAACELFGINLPKEQLAIAAKNQEEVVEVDITKSEVTETAETIMREDLETRKKYVKEMPNLDPEKVTDEEDLKKSLIYLITNQSANMASNLLVAIEFMRKYRHSIAKSADDKLALEDRTISDWVEDVLEFAGKPSLLINGIMNATGSILSTHGNPIMAHVLLSTQLRGKEAVCPLNDEQVASLVQTFVKIRHRYATPIMKDGVEVKQDIFENKALKALYNGSEDTIDAIIALDTPESKAAFSKTREYYYGVNSKNINEYKDINWKQLLRPKFGQIINLYLPLESRMENYLGMPSEITEYPAKAPAKTEPVTETKADEKKK